MASTITGHDQIPNWNAWTPRPAPVSRSIGNLTVQTEAETWAQWYPYPPSSSPVDPSKPDGPQTMADDFDIEVKIVPNRSWVSSTIFPAPQDSLDQKTRKQAHADILLDHERGHYFITGWTAMDFFNDVLALIKPQPTVFPNTVARTAKFDELKDNAFAQRNFLYDLYDAAIHNAMSVSDSEFARVQAAWNRIFAAARSRKSMRDGWLAATSRDLVAIVKSMPLQPNSPSRFPVYR
jgi:hypothetical protein